MSSDPSNPSRNTRQTAQKRTATVEDEDSPPIIKRRVAPRTSNANAGPSSNGVTPVRLFPQGVAVKKKRRLNFAKPNAEFVEILVGEDEANFKLYKDAIVESSPHFKVIFNNKKGPEGESKILKLPDVEAEVFVLFNNWLNTDKIDHTDLKAPELMELAKLWTKAGDWEIPALQNQAMHLLIRLINDSREAPTQDKDNILKEFYQHAYATKGETCLKKLAVHKMTCHIPQLVSFDDWVSEFPEGMMADITKAWIKHHASLPKEYKYPPIKTAEFLVKE